MNKLILLISLIAMQLFVLPAQAESELQKLPVQEAGRVKPFDTFAREALQSVYGKQEYEKQPAFEIVLTWILNPQLWEEKEIVEIRNGALKDSLKLDKARRYFSPKEIMSLERLPMLMQELNSKRQAKEKLDPFNQSVQQLENALFTFREVAAGRSGGLYPPKTGDRWFALSELSPEVQPLFMAITKAFLAQIGARVEAKDETAAQAEMVQAVQAFIAAAKAENPAIYPDLQKINMEVFYHAFHPFHWAWMLYLLAVLALASFWILQKPVLVKASWLLGAMGFLLHTYGFAVRVYLTERAPVTNMYETVVWVSWGSVLFAFLLEYKLKNKFTLLAGFIVGFFCLLLSDMAPTVLDPTLQPLEPVLRSNFWLSTHVTIITVSYAAFFLAFVLGDIGLYYYLKGEKQHADKITLLVNGIYRSMQIGVALLAPGIILGGIWADYSWGRFWGWDPKETWALIALLGYLAVLHGRLSGMIKSFGMIVAGIVTFSLVIMAWYGVNYVLGAGLHSYGFGAGGLEYVAAFVFIHFVLVISVALIRKGREISA